MHVADHAVALLNEANQRRAQHVAGHRLSHVLDQSPAVGLRPPAQLRVLERQATVAPGPHLVVDHRATGREAHQTVGAVRLHSQTITRLPAIVEGSLQATPQADDLAVGPAPLVDNALKDGLAAQRVAAHSTQ